MKIIDQAAPTRKPSKGIFNQYVSRFTPAKSPAAVTSAPQVLTNNLEKLLDDQYILLRNIQLSNSKNPIPAILLGPTGLYVIYPSEVAGVFRAAGSSWDQVKNNRHDYVPAKPNPFQIVISMAGLLSKYLAENQIEPQVLEPLVFFSNPSIHVDTTQPAARIIMPDTLERFVAGLFQTQPVFDRQAIYRIVRALENSMHKTQTMPAQEIRDQFSFNEPQPGKSPRQSPFSYLPKEEPSLTQKVPFSRTQWSMLVLLIFVNIIVLTTLVVVFLKGG